MKSKSVKMSYELVNVTELNVRAYQRDLRMLKAKEMAKNFDTLLLTTITVSRRDGKLNVIDGQHRTVAAKMAGLKELMACVYDGLTYEEEAVLFEKLNTTSIPLSTADKFNAKVEAKDDDALAVKKIVEDLGFKIAKASGTNIITAVRALQNIYKKHGSSHLHNTLLLIKETWGGECESLSGKMLQGVSGFINIYEKDFHFSKDTFTKQLSKVTSKQIVAETRNDQSTNNANIKTMNILHKYYNVRLRYRLNNKHFVA